MKVKIDYPQDFPQLAKDLVSRLLKKDPSHRLSIKEMKKHPWFEITNNKQSIFS